MQKEFLYLEKDRQFFPIIDITLKKGRQELNLKALIDSGASFSVFRPEVAEELGIVLEQGKKVYLTGIGGRILGYVHNVALKIGGHVFMCKIVFSPEFTVSFNLLGRNNFFLPFTISFFEKNRRVVVRTSQ